MSQQRSALGELAISFTCDPKRSLYEQFCKAQGVYEGQGKLKATVRRAGELAADDGSLDSAPSADEGTGQKSLSAIHINPTSTVCSHSSRTPPRTSNGGRRPPRTRLEWTLTAQIAWMDTPPLTSVILLGCQRQTCLWRKRMVSFFTNRGMSNCLVRCDNFFATSLDTHAVPSVAPRQSSIPSQQDYPQRGRLESRNTFQVSNSQFGNSGVPLNSSTATQQLFLVNGHTRTMHPHQKSQHVHLPTSPVPRSSFVRYSRVEECTNAWSISRGTFNYTRWNGHSSVTDATRRSLDRTIPTSISAFT